MHAMTMSKTTGYGPLNRVKMKYVREHEASRMAPGPGLDLRACPGEGPYPISGRN